MIRQAFDIGEHDWRFEVWYDVRTDDDLQEVYECLLDAGMTMRKANVALQVLTGYNHGLTYTVFGDRRTLMFMSKTTSAEQMYDSIQHETRHAADHVGEYYGLAARGEEQAYLQGEIARKMFPAAAMVVCPRCHQE